MARSRVYLIEPERPWKRMDRLLSQSKLADRVGKNDIVAIKLHFGELGNTRYIRPILARKIVEFVKEVGGRPFLTDTTTLYRHARHTLFDYLDTAAKNGFTRESMGCPILIADGLRGTNGEWVEIESFSKFKKVKVAQFIFEADFLISLAHMTFHIKTGFAGSIKNVAMGCTTKETKLAMHASEAKPVYDEDRCTLCMICVDVCPSSAFYRQGKEIVYERERCVGCGECIAYCSSGAIKIPWSSVMALDLQKGLMDGFRGVASTFDPEKIIFINLGFDITPNCDCDSSSDLPAVPDVGILVSEDALACDKASYDLVVAAPPYPGSQADKKRVKAGEEKIKSFYPDVDISQYWQLCRKAKLGNLEYELEIIS